MKSPPNIVYLHAHDAGRFVQPYGYAVETPHLMEFARSSVLFRRAFATAPTCGPSRCSMLTGQYPHQIGVYGLPGHQGWEIDDYRKHIVRVLGEAGYRTALAGVMHEVSVGNINKLGYDELLLGGPDDTPGEFFIRTIDSAIEFLAREHSDPFFLSIGIDEPHRNNTTGRDTLRIDDSGDCFSKTRYYDPERLDWRYSAPPPFLPDVPSVRKDFRSYSEGVRIMDEYMGRVFFALEHYGYTNNTIVLVTTDHGIEFPGAKKTLSNAGTGVMLMLRVPGRFRMGRVVESLVSHIDIYPTLLELVGLPNKPWTDGKSLVPILSGDVESVRDHLFSEQTYHETLEPLRAVRTERYSYIRRHFATGPRMRIDGTVTNPFFESVGWFDRNIGHEEFFDLYLDPTESCNRINESRYTRDVDRLRTLLDTWMENTNDPFLNGIFPEPPATL